jgi:hypothetical protein
MEWVLVVLALLQHPLLAVDFLRLASGDPGVREAALVRICHFGTPGEMPRLLPLTRCLEEKAGDPNLRAQSRQLTDCFEVCLLVNAWQRAARENRSSVIRLRDRAWFVDRAHVEPLPRDGDGAGRRQEPGPAPPGLVIDALSNILRR